MPLNIEGETAPTCRQLWIKTNSVVMQGQSGEPEHHQPPRAAMWKMLLGGKAEFRRRRRSRVLQLLDIGGDMHALDGRELRHVMRRQPVEEFMRSASIGAARVRVADVGGEEIKEAVGGVFAKGGGKGRSEVGDDGDELIYGSDLVSSAFSSFLRSRSNLSMSFGVASATSLRPAVVGLSEILFKSF
jgi:hypothetical protein